WAGVLAMELICGDRTAVGGSHSDENANGEATILKAQEAIGRRGYSVHFLLATTGNVDTSMEDDARMAVRAVHDGAEFEVLRGRDIEGLFKDYINDAAPAVPWVDFHTSSGEPAGLPDSPAGIDAFVLYARATDMASAYEKAGVRLFAQNVRGFL